MTGAVTAVVLTARRPDEPLRLAGADVLYFVSRFSGAAGHQASRLESLQGVRTPWFFWLDDDDELPDDYERVLGRCTDVCTPLAYTDELVTSAAGGRPKRRRGRRYSQDAHVRDPMLVHHLAVCRTDAALRAAAAIPRGHYGVENMLFFEVAKGGATYINDVGYVWHRRETGLNRDPALVAAQVRSAVWADRNRT